MVSDEDDDDLTPRYVEGQLRVDIEKQRVVVVDFEDVCPRTGTWIEVRDLDDRKIQYGVRPERLGPVMNEMEVIAWSAKTSAE